MVLTRQQRLRQQIIDQETTEPPVLTTDTSSRWVAAAQVSVLLVVVVVYNIWSAGNDAYFWGAVAANILLLLYDASLSNAGWAKRRWPGTKSWRSGLTYGKQRATQYGQAFVGGMGWGDAIDTRQVSQIVETHTDRYGVRFGAWIGRLMRQFVGIDTPGTSIVVFVGLIVSSMAMAYSRTYQDAEVTLWQSVAFGVSVALVWRLVFFKVIHWTLGNYCSSDTVCKLHMAPALATITGVIGSILAIFVPLALFNKSTGPTNGSGGFMELLHHAIFGLPQMTIINTWSAYNMLVALDIIKT